MTAPTHCFTHTPMDLLQKYKRPHLEERAPSLVANLGKFVVCQIGTAILAASALVESVIYLALMILTAMAAPFTTRPCKFFAHLYKNSAFTTFWAVTEFFACRANTLYSAPERLLRTAVFQLGVKNEGGVEGCLISTFGYLYCTGTGVDETRAARNEAALRACGGWFLTAQPSDGKASIEFMKLESRTFEERITEVGGTWVRKRDGNKTVFAIVPPDQVTAGWTTLKAHLDRFHWPERDIDGKRCLITCENADLIPDNKEHSQLFIQMNNPNTTFLMHIDRMAFYLGCKQDICFFDPRGRGNSTGLASEAGFNHDLQAVYLSAKANRQPGSIWVSGICGSCPTVGYFRKTNPEVNIILESGFNSLWKDFVNTQDPISSGIAWNSWQGLYARDFKSTKGEQTGFSLEKHWEDPTKTDAKVMIVTVLNDNHLKRTVGPRNYELAQTVSTRASHLTFVAPLDHDNPHGALYSEYPDPTRNGLAFIFG